jgi:hypothetical protein
MCNKMPLPSIQLGKHMGIWLFFLLIPGLFWKMDLAFSESIWLFFTADLAYIVSSDLATLLFRERKEGRHWKVERK